MVKKILNIFLAMTFVHIPSKISTYRGEFDKTNCMTSLIKDEKLLAKYNKVWKNISCIVKKEFDSKPEYDEKYLKTKIKSYNGKININFQNNKIPEKDSQCACLSVISIDSVYRKNKNYYPQVFLERYVYMLLKKKRHLSLLLMT